MYTDDVIQESIVEISRVTTSLLSLIDVTIVVFGAMAALTLVYVLVSISRKRDM